jgi:Translation initiation factor IF-2, N-terminal region.
MSRIKISEISNELGYPSKEVIEKAQELGMKVKTHSDCISLEDAEKLYEYINTGVTPKTLPQDDLTKYLKETKLTKDVSVGIGIAINSEINIHKEFLAKVKKKLEEKTKEVEVMEASKADPEKMRDISVEVIKLLGIIDYINITLKRLESDVNKIEG